MPLTSPRFRWNARLQAAENNNPALKRRAQGTGVRLIQQSMIDLTISPMTASVRKYGSPDGIFGDETVAAVKKYQRNKNLKDDGIVGRNTMQALDTDLPGGGPKLPALPGVNLFSVSGLVVARDQLRLGHSNLCWAYTYTMMMCWKNQQGFDARQLVANIGPSWLTHFDANLGLPRSLTTQFYTAAGLRVEALQSIPISEWGRMLRAYGPLAVHGLNNSLGGGHVRMLYGVRGDGEPEGTTMLIMDPWRGAEYGESYEKFIEKMSGSGAISGRTTQVGHF